MFRRKNTCPSCQQIACADCLNKKALITAGTDPKSKAPTRKETKVCDACFGYLTGMIGPKLGPTLSLEEAQLFSSF